MPFLPKSPLWWVFGGDGKGKGVRKNFSRLTGATDSMPLLCYRDLIDPAAGEIEFAVRAGDHIADHAAS